MIQLAVEWLQEQIFNSDWKNMSGEDKLKLFEKAKQIETQQIIRAFNKGAMQPQRMGTDYFDETYKNNIWDL